MDHPIKAFIYEVFGDSKSNEKKNEWAQYFINEEYDTIE
jgi:hypothetical protein